MKAALLGPPQNRIDGRLKVTGGATYAEEFAIDDLAYGYLVTSNVARGRISQIMTRAAEKAPGVIAVFTHLNAPPFVGAVHAPNKSTRQLCVLQDDVIHYNGQPIALVIAETLEQAAGAAGLVRASYSEDESALDIDAEAKHSYKPRQAYGPKDYLRGDVRGGLRTAVHTIREIYITPMISHSAMEPHGSIAVWEGPRHLTVYDTTQGVHDTRSRLAIIFEMPPDNVRVISYFIGGGFGSKSEVWAQVPLAAVAARAIGRPVKLAFTRRQLFCNTGFRSHTIQTIALGAGTQGRFTAQQHESITQTSELDEFVETCGAATPVLYSCANVESTHRLVRLHLGTPTWTRAPGYAPGSFALESALDELSYKVGVDPIELRLLNYAERDEQEDKPWSSNSLKECYRVGAEKFGWGSRPSEPRSMPDGSHLVGYGMATAMHPVYINPAAALARILADGTVILKVGSQDIGTGTYTVMAQIACDVLDLPIQRVKVELGDSRFPESPASVGSTTAASTGSAVHAAAQAVLQKLAHLAVNDKGSLLYGANVADVIAEKGGLALKNNLPKRDSFSAILARAKLLQIEAEVQAKPDQEKSTSQYAFGAQFCEVRVDPCLGQVKVSRFVGVYGSGRILNRKTARSQMVGGIIFGIGMALMEETVPDLRTGRIVNADLASYHLPVSADVPNIDVVFLEESDKAVNPMGVKGLGELGITGAAAAIANAVFHATGKRVRDLPITAEKLI